MQINTTAEAIAWLKTVRHFNCGSVITLLEDAEKREAALREDLYQAKEARDTEMLNGVRLQQRLTVAEQQAFELTGLLKLSLLAVEDVAENCEDRTDWATANSMHALSKRITDTLKPAAEGEGS